MNSLFNNHVSDKIQIFKHSSPPSMPASPFLSYQHQVSPSLPPIIEQPISQHFPSFFHTSRLPHSLPLAHYANLMDYHAFIQQKRIHQPIPQTFGLQKFLLHHSLFTSSIQQQLLFSPQFVSYFLSFLFSEFGNKNFWYWVMVLLIFMICNAKTKEELLIKLLAVICLFLLLSNANLIKPRMIMVNKVNMRFDEFVEIIRCHTNVKVNSDCL